MTQSPMTVSPLKKYLNNTLSGICNLDLENVVEVDCTTTAQKMDYSIKIFKVV